MRMNFQEVIKEASEQIKIHLKDKQIEAISNLLTDVISTSFVANVIQLVSPGLRSKQLLELHQTLFPHPIH